MTSRTEDIMAEYSKMEDFGFSAGPSSREIQGERSLRERLESVEKLVMPLLAKLYETAQESDTIYWPNREKILKKKIGELLSLTRPDDQPTPKE